MSQPSEPPRALVLIVDDNVDGCKALARMVRHLGFRGVCLESGALALAYLRTARPALIVLDVMMPHMDGFEVLQEIRRDPATNSIPVVMYSALTDDQSISRARRLGANDFWVKSLLDFDDLRQRITSYLPPDAIDSAAENTSISPE